jgi:hypothetical protein
LGVGTFALIWTLGKYKLLELEQPTIRVYGLAYTYLHRGSLKGFIGEKIEFVGA